MPNSGANFIASELRLEHSVSVGGYQISSVAPTQEVGSPLPRLLTSIGLTPATSADFDWAPPCRTSAPKLGWAGRDRRGARECADQTADY